MNMKFKKFCLLAGILVFLIPGMTGCRKDMKEMKEVVYLTEPRSFNSTEAMIKASDTIIIGKVTDVQNPRKINVSLDKNFVSESVYTVSEFTVEVVLKGNVKKDEVIEVKQLGGTYNNVKYKDVNTTFLEKEKEYLLFLEGYKDVSPTMPYSIVTPNGGSLVLDSATTREDALNLYKPLIN